MFGFSNTQEANFIDITKTYTSYIQKPADFFLFETNV